MKKACRRTRCRVQCRAANARRRPHDHIRLEERCWRRIQSTKANIDSDFGVHPRTDLVEPLQIHSDTIRVGILALVQFTARREEASSCHRLISTATNFLKFVS